MTLTKNKRPRHPEGDGGRGGGAGSLGSLHLGPGLPAEGAPGFTPPGRPPGVQSDSWSTDPSRAGAGQEGGSQRGQRGGGSSRPGPLAGHSWLCPGCLQQSQSVKKKKKKNTDLVSFCFQSGQGERRETGAGVPHTIRGTSGSQAEPLPAEGGGYRPHPAPKGSPSWHGWARRGRGGAEGAPGWAEPPIPVFHPASPGPPPQIRLRVV